MAVETSSPASPMPALVCNDVDYEPTYLCYMMHRFLDFRVPELQAVAELHGCTADELQIQRPVGTDMSPFWYAKFRNEHVAKCVAERMILMKGMFELWGEGTNMEELKQAIESYPASRRAAWSSVDTSFKIVVDGWGKKFTAEESLDMIEQLSFLDFKGPVRLRDPDVKFWLIVADVSKQSGLPDEVPSRMYFGREIQLSPRGPLVNTYALPQRRYLGPTSMDTEMAFVMCNQAKVMPRQLVYDPFVGTGSILVAAAHYGALTVGTDIDIKVIRDGKQDVSGQKCNIWTNFKDYKLPEPVGLIRTDVHHLPFRDDLREWLHAVICDPPYGVRAGGKKLAVNKDVNIKSRETHIPGTVPYTLGECCRDLLDLAAKLLVVGGRLVYFLPSCPTTAHEAPPPHPSLRLVADSEQILSSRYSRRLVTMEKCKPYDDAEVAAFFADNPDPTLAIDRIHDWVYEPKPQEPSDDPRVTNKRRYRGKNH